MYTLVLAIAIVLVLWFLRDQSSSIRRNGRSLPRPPGTLPLVGNGVRFLQPRHKLLEWFAQCESRSGFETLEISVPSLPPAIVIYDPRNVEHVLKNNDIFVKGAFFRQRSWDLFGNGIINADGELWRIQRKAGLRFFSITNLRSFINDVLPSMLTDTTIDLDQAAKELRQIDLQETIHALTTRLMGQVAYDMDMPSTLPFSKAFDYASGAIGLRFQNPFWRVTELIWGQPLRKAVFEVRRFGDAIVCTAVAKRNRQSTAVKDSNMKHDADRSQSHLIDSLLDHIDDHRVVADAAMNYLSAGRDTTAQALTWVFYLLMRHPDVQDKILAELKGAFPKAQTVPPVDFDTVQATTLPYTCAVFNETLRLYPPVPVEIKECTGSTTFPDGTWLPNGSVVIWVPWAMGRSKGIWGADAEFFRPARWLEQDEHGHKTLTLSKTPFEFPVFNGGPRSCLGKKMAESLAVYLIAKLVWRYRITEVLEDPEAETHKPRISQNSLTLPMAGGLPCRFALRSELGGT